MTARLESFRYLPAAVDGWETPELPFGDLFTAVQGENGVGKTPVMKGIMMALGHELQLPPDIIEHCSHAQLKLDVDGRIVTLTRSLHAEFDLRIQGEEEVFTSPQEYARWFAELMGTELRELTSKGIPPGPRPLYASLIFPGFWVDQDHGWTVAYFTPPDKNFINDQRQEVIRFLTGLPPRHPFKDKTDYDKAREKFDGTVRLVEIQRGVVDRLRVNGKFVDGEEATLTARRDALRAELDQNGQTIEAVRSIAGFFEKDIVKLERTLDDLRSRATGLSRRKGQLKLALSELTGEVEILGANVQASELLRGFCGNEGCEMFASSEQSYGRALLYLKDQIKDLKVSDRDVTRDEQALAEEVAGVEAEIAERHKAREEALAASPEAQLITKLNAITKELVAVQVRLASYQQLAAEQQRFEQLLNRREQDHAVMLAARPRGGKAETDPVIDARQQLTVAMQRWLAILRTKNIKTPAVFDEDFNPVIDGVKFSVSSYQSGSTRTRIVLAFHAAILEVALSRGGNHPGWMLFDAPKQHELDQRDFDAYAEELKLLSERHRGSVQLVFSVADLKTYFEATDEVWLPSYTDAGGELRFLGPATQRA
ncbi:MAG: hypothetical protein U0Q11_14170 [Vicinamibacterales bacterium]